MRSIVAVYQELLTHFFLCFLYCTRTCMNWSVVAQMMSQQRYLDHEEAQHRRVLGEYKDLLENHVKLRADTTKVCGFSDLWSVQSTRVDYLFVLKNRETECVTKSLGC